jgi:hypothetical protein
MKMTATKDGILGELRGGLFGGALGALGGPATAIAGAGLGSAIGNKLDPMGEDSAPKFAQNGKLSTPDCSAMSTQEIRDWRAQQVGLAREA